MLSPWPTCSRTHATPSWVVKRKEQRYAQKNALIIGIANPDSISAGIARELYTNGYTIIPTYLNDKALPYVKAVTDRLDIRELFPFKVGNEAQLQAVIAYLQEHGMRLDVFVHNIAYASEIKKKLHEVSWHSFKDSVRVSAFSIVVQDRQPFKHPGAGQAEIALEHQCAQSGYCQTGRVRPGKQIGDGDGLHH